MDEVGVDFAFVAWREEGRWILTVVPEDLAQKLDSLIDFARQRQGDSGSLAFVSVADDFFVCARIQGAKSRVLLSDVSITPDYALAEEAAESLGLDTDDIDELTEIEPAGDLTLLADYGMTAEDIDLLCSDPELYPDEQIGSIAARVGFDQELSALLDVSARA